MGSVTPPPVKRGRPVSPIPTNEAVLLELAVANVERAEAELARRRGELRDAVRRASDAGGGVRAIAEVLGVSPSTVSKLTA